MAAKPYTDTDVENLAAVARARIGWPISAGEAATIVTVVLEELTAFGRLAPVDDRHILQVDATGWGIQHPLACRPNLLSCPVQLTAAPELAAAKAMGRTIPPGRYECSVGDFGDTFQIGDCIDHEDG